MGARAARRLASRAVRRLRYGPLRYVVVVSYGRTGSTLLQGVLMSAPHVMVRGEQGGTISQLQVWYDELCRHQQRLGRRYETHKGHPFYGMMGFRREEALQRLRALLVETVLRPTSDVRVIGFKEIGWPDDVMPTLLFLRKLLPGVRFVFNTRDDESVAKSGFWSRREDALPQIQRLRENMLAAARELGDDAYVVHYDDWVGDPERLRPMFEWLQIDFDLDRVRAVMQRPHSYEQRSLPQVAGREQSTDEPSARPS